MASKKSIPCSLQSVGIEVTAGVRVMMIDEDDAICHTQIWKTCSTHIYLFNYLFNKDYVYSYTYFKLFLTIFFFIIY